MDDIEYTPEELARAHQIIAAEQARQAALAQARADAYAAPVRDLVGSNAWSDVVTAVTDIHSTLEPDNNLSVHVGALSEIMPRLAGLIPPVIITQPVA